MIFLIFISILQATVSTAEPFVSDLEVINHVIKRYPQISISESGVQIADAQVMRSLGAFDFRLESDVRTRDGNYDYEYLDARLVKPTSLFGLDLYGRYRQSRGGLPVYDGDLETLDQGEWGVGLRLPLLRGFLIDDRRAGLQRSKLELERQKISLFTTQLNEVRNSVRSYWKWRLTLEKLRVQKNLLEIALQRNEWLKKKIKAGDIAQFEGNDNQRTVLEREAMVIQADLELRVATAELLVFISDDKLVEEIELFSREHQAVKSQKFNGSQDEIASRPVNELIQMAISARPELGSIEIENRQLEIERALSQNFFLPTLNLGVEQSKDRGVGPENLTSLDTKVFVQFELPLQFREARGRLRENTLERDQLKFRQDLLKRKIAAEVKILAQGLVASTRRRNLSEQEFQLALKLEKGERSRFQRGESNILIVNLREQAAAEAEIRFFESSADVMLGAAALRLTLGELPAGAQF